MSARQASVIEAAAAQAQRVGSQSERYGKHASLVVAIVAGLVGAAALYYFTSRGLANIYGDGLYHLIGARRLIDGNYNSFAERYAQIGTPWLPLPHIGMLPFIWNDYLWRSGLAGGLVSYISFVIASVILFKLALLFYRDERQPLFWASLVAFIFIFNLGLLYMQSTPMTEPLFIAVLVSSVYFLQKWALGQQRCTLAASGFLMALASLTRYEAWAILPFAGLVVLLLSHKRGAGRIYDGLIWSGLAALGPLYWLWHNYFIFNNPLEFYNGPYSAKVIYLSGGYRAITHGDLSESFKVVFAAARLCAGYVIWILAAIGLLQVCWLRRRAWCSCLPTLLLVVPLAFHLYSLYTGNIEMMVIRWWYNARYALLYLPAIAILAPASVLIIKRERLQATLIIALVMINYGVIYWRGIWGQSVFIEAYRNNVLSPDWAAREQISRYLRANRPKEMILLDPGLGSVVAPSGLNFKSVKFFYSHKQHDPWSAVGRDIETIITRKDSPLWKLLKDPSVNEAFNLEYSTSGESVFTVWSRRRAQKAGSGI